MEMSSGQRKAVFALIVLALAGFGIYLVMPAARGASPPRSAPSPHVAHAGRSPAAAPSQAALAGASPSAAAQTAPDIYQWLPFTESDLASASTVVTQFSKAYGTWSYTQSASQYAATMNGLATSDLTQSVAQGYSVPGVASVRTSDRQVSAGTAVINALRAFGSSSLTFIVTISQEITSTVGTRQVSGQYAVTVAGNGSAWQVSDIELASAGNS
jgi:hypothetical protein